jgi:hypothetical protein
LPEINFVNQIAVIELLQNGLGANIQLSNQRDLNNEPVGDIAVTGFLQPQRVNEIKGSVVANLIDELPMKPANKYGNKFANYIMQRVLSIPDVDVSTGFRAYTREAALRLNVLSNHTYTHETLINALDQQLRIVNVPIAARHVERPSRLIRSIRSHVMRAGMVILRSFLLYRPMQVYGSLGAVLLALGAVPFARYAYFFSQGESAGHIQSLVVGAALWIIGGQMLITGLLATAIAWNRRMLEDVLYRMKSERGAGETRAHNRRLAAVPRIDDGGAPHTESREESRHAA